ncbi:hypothetical protein IPV08_07490 [Methylobacterium sp. SD274]|uniref:hypothetical protein n=1 Tax=Methylobacterium sp. SD274 TaxID=2782009 RepID=UPI001A973C4D|nr:hypothetical protein [Methylobacterium sp. SD274]MBO1019806.1 hypothetical protein [Methylobacterium sp. SD274]
MSLPVPIRGILNLLLGAACSLPLLTAPVAAQVRFGPGVRIGGHDFSNRRYGSVHIQRVKRLPGPAGCRHLRNGMYRRGDGSVVRGPMERCNLIAIPPERRR